MIIPFNDLKALHASIQSSLDNAIANALQGYNFIRGAEVRHFEESFANVLSARYCISTGSGTDALFTILKALNIKPGDEVITPALSWISTAEVITLCGAKPVFADVEDPFYTLSVTDVRKRISKRTKAVIAVHLFGQMVDMKSLSDLCKQHNLFLVEDCAQAHLSSQQEKFAGTLGDAAAFSFYPTKNLGAYGDAGCIVTNNDILAETMRRFSNHGALDKDDHLIEGMNSRMDTLQAAILLAKLPHLKHWNERRQANAARYMHHLSSVAEVTLPVIRTNTQHTFHLFVIRARNRNQLKEFLSDQGIQTIIHYPQALHNLPAYRYLGHRPEDFPLANALQEEVLSLPVHPALTTVEIDYVCTKIKEFYHK